MAIPTVHRRWPFRGSRGPLAAAALLLGAAAAALAQGPDSGLVSIERLRFEKKCFFEVEEWKSRGEDAFLAKLEEQKKLYKADKEKAAQVGSLEVLMAEAYWARKEELEKAGKLDDASKAALAINDLESKDPKVLDLRKKADDFRIKLNFDKAEKFFSNGDLPQAHASYLLCRGAANPDIAARVVSGLVQIAKSNGKYDEVMKESELDAEGVMLDAVLVVVKKDLGGEYEKSRANPALAGLEKARDEIQNTSQLIQVEPLDVKASLAAYEAHRGRAADVDAKTVTFSLTPAGSGKPFPASGVPAPFKKNPFRWHRGTYDVRVFIPGEGGEGRKPFATRVGFVLGKDPETIRVPNRVPEGMVWMPAETAGGESLFVDRCEVTVKQVVDAAGSDEKLLSVLKDSREGKAGDNHPAWFPDEESVAAYEKATGKKAPNLLQWQQAAFGSFSQTQRPFPWGTASPDESRAYTKVNGELPAEVGGRPNGASPCGAEDMAGNLCEWVRQGSQLWLIGGDYFKGDAGLTSFEGHNTLREARPGVAVFQAMSTDQQNQYAKYKFDAKNDYYTSGLRTVIPVTAK
jgi:hypothetical protein